MMNELIHKLKEADQDFELYPSTDEMFKVVHEHIKSNINHRSIASVLDIGAGTCGLYHYLNKNKSGYDENYGYYVIEKSKILLELMPKDIITLGIDFDETTLMDKQMDFIFCNPPYSKFVQWTVRILSESNTFNIYLIIPERWKTQKEILDLLKTLNAKYEILGSFDFLDADRISRAKVDVIYINKSNRGEYSSFDRWFEEHMVTTTLKVETSEEKKERIHTAVKLSKNPIDTLVDSFLEDQDKLMDHFKTICSLDSELLKQINVCKKTVKEALQKNMEGLKVLYWGLAFENFEEITSRLTSKSRGKFMEKFKTAMNAEFSKDNIYVFIIWVIKNANNYIEDQIVDFYKELSREENVIPYISNQKTFDKQHWRYLNSESGMKWTLDYRIICGHNILRVYHYGAVINDWETKNKLMDMETICRNLGFNITRYDHPGNIDYGKNGYFYMDNGSGEEIAFEYKFFKNLNLHIKFNKKIIKSLNVTTGKIMKWIKVPGNIKEEFDNEHEMAEGAEVYFDVPLKLTTNRLNILGRCDIIEDEGGK